MRSTVIVIGSIVGVAAVCFLGLWLLVSAAGPMPSERAPRFVALAPAISQMITALGGQRYIKGRHSYDAWVDPGIRVVGDQSGIDYDALISSQPSHVLLQWGERELPPRLQELAASQGWIVKNYPLLTLSDVEAAAKSIDAYLHPEGGLILGPERSPELLKAIDAMKGDYSMAGRILILHTCSPPTVLGPGSYHHQLLERLGITPAVTEGKAYMTMDVEDVLRLDPDGIILVQPKEVERKSLSVGEAPTPPPPPKAASGQGASMEGRLGRLGTVGLRAVKNGHVAVIDDPMALVPGLNLSDVAAEMKRIVEGWAK